MPLDTLTPIGPSNNMRPEPSRSRGTLLQQTEPVTLLDALGQYVNSFKAKHDGTQAQQELLRFVNWCGPDRTLAELKPPEIGDYGDKVGASGPQMMDRLQEVKKFLAFAKKTGLIEQNLAQHIRIRKGRSRSRREQKLEDNAFELTPEGYKQLNEEMEGLKGERLPLAQMIRQAALDKDVRENVPLEAAREQLGLAESRITQIERTLKSSVVVDTSKRREKAVAVGSKVLLKDTESGRETRYTVVSAAEANPLESRISDASPVGKALLKRSTGDDIEVETPRGKLQYKIVKVS